MDSPQIKLLIIDLDQAIKSGEQKRYAKAMTSLINNIQDKDDLIRTLNKENRDLIKKNLQMHIERAQLIKTIASYKSELNSGRANLTTLSCIPVKGLIATIPDTKSPITQK